MRGKEGCTENCIVPIEDDTGLMSLRLVSWGNPYFFVSKLHPSRIYVSIKHFIHMSSHADQPWGERAWLRNKIVMNDSSTLSISYVKNWIPDIFF